MNFKIVISNFFKNPIKVLKRIYKFRKGYYISSKAIIKNKKLLILGNKVEINEFVIIKTYESFVKIGQNSQINPFSVIYGGSGVNIGMNVMIAPHCMIASGNHDFKQTKTSMRFSGSISKGPITISDNVWIGANSTITDGVFIGENSVIAAGSVVTKNVKPWSIVGGVPAKQIGWRKKNGNNI